MSRLPGAGFGAEYRRDAVFNQSEFFLVPRGPLPPPRCDPVQEMAIRA